MQKFVNKLIDNAVRKVDRYVNNGSTWLIFTQEKKWVIELTKEGTLWYNYNFFKNVFSFLGLDVVENQHYITKWVEDNVIRVGVKVANKSLRVDDSCLIQDTIKDGVKNTKLIPESAVIFSVENTIENGVKQLRHRKGADDTRAENIILNGVKDTRKQTVTSQIVVENTIQNGVKETGLHEGVRPLAVNNTIHNGVKQTYSGGDVCRNDSIEDTIDKGVKEIKKSPFSNFATVENTIQNGVKYTGDKQGNYNLVVEDTIQNGVKHTIDTTHHRNKLVEDTIDNGVKKTYSDKIPHEYDWSDQFTEDVEDTIQNGVKEVQPLPAQDGNMDYSNYYYRQGDRTKPHTQYVNDVIENSIKETIL